MRALIRTHEDGTQEVMTEPFSAWVENNLAFLTGTEVDSEGNPMRGDGWVLVEDYHHQEGTENGPEGDSEVTEASQVEDAPVEVTEPVPEVTEETVTYGGRTYTLDELRKLLE